MSIKEIDDKKVFEGLTPAMEKAIIKGHDLLFPNPLKKLWPKMDLSAFEKIKDIDDEEIEAIKKGKYETNELQIAIGILTYYRREKLLQPEGGKEGR